MQFGKHEKIQSRLSKGFDFMKYFWFIILFTACNRIPSNSRVNSDLNSIYGMSGISISEAELLSQNQIDTTEFAFELRFPDSSSAKMRIGYLYNHQFNDWGVFMIRTESVNQIPNVFSEYMTGNIGYEHDTTTYKMDLNILAKDYSNSFCKIDSNLFKTFILNTEDSVLKLVIISQDPKYKSQNGSVTLTDMNNYIHVQYIPFSTSDLWIGELNKCR